MHRKGERRETWYPFGKLLTSTVLGRACLGLGRKCLVSTFPAIVGFGAWAGFCGYPAVVGHPTHRMITTASGGLSIPIFRTALHIVFEPATMLTGIRKASNLKFVGPRQIAPCNSSHPDPIAALKPLYAWSISKVSSLTCSGLSSSVVLI
jgi:hypothetical protein